MAATWVLLAACAAPRVAGASDVVVMHPSVPYIDLCYRMSLLADPGGNLTYTQVSSAATSARFSPARGRVAFGDASGVWWIRARIKNGAATPAQYFVIIDWRDLRSIRAFIPSGATVLEKQSGWLVPLVRRDIYAPFHSFSIRLSPAEAKTIYIRVESPERIFLPVTIWSEQAVYRRILTEAIFTGGYFGILIALMLYNLVLFFRLRQRYMLLYVLFILVYIAWWLVFGGYYGVSQTLLSMGTQLPLALGMLYVFSRVWFARAFLDIARVAPRWDLALRILQYGLVPLTWLASGLMGEIGGEGLQVLGNLALFAVAVHCARRGVRQAKIYAVAAGMVAFGFSLSALAFAGVVDIPIPMLGFPVLAASLVELIVLSLALSEHVRGMEAQRKEAQARAQADQLQTMRSLVAGVVHELNTPLGSIRSGVAALHRAGTVMEISDEQERAKKMARLKKVLPQLSDTTNEAVDRMGIVLSSLKTYSRLDESEVKPMDLNQAMDAVLVLLGRELGRVTVRFSSGELSPVICRPAEINQVLMAVLKNAAEAMEGQGTLRVMTQAVEGGARVTVQDDGRGISKDELARIFNPQFSHKGSRVRLGLGLPTSLSIVEAHGGRMSIRSTPDEGTTVTIDLPLELVES